MNTCLEVNKVSGLINGITMENSTEAKLLSLIFNQMGTWETNYKIKILIIGQYVTCTIIQHFIFYISSHYNVFLTNMRVYPQFSTIIIQCLTWSMTST